MTEAISGSFRDPSGFLYIRNSMMYRQINLCYQADYDALISSGLYQQLVKKGYLIAHEEVAETGCNDEVYKVIKPERLAFISYPYEWCFSQLQDAALLTLEIQRMALLKDLSLKDASAYNIQFHQGLPVFIDTLSFERLVPDQPWVAYRQFCQHFLAPLALMAKTDVSLNQLFTTNIDGAPLGLASKLLPLKSRISWGLGVHIHLHAKSQAKNANKDIHQIQKKMHFSKNAFLALIDSLKSTIEKLEWQPAGTEWYDYYEENNNYEKNSLIQKDILVEEFMQKNPAHITWDFGANTGRFSRIAAKYSDIVCAWDIDPACVEINYRQSKALQEKTLLSLLLNLTTPTPAIGWNNNERMSLGERGPVDMILALGLIHHLAISNNLPLRHIASFLAGLSQRVILEFVPKEDSQVKKLLQNREDIFPQYHQQGFEDVFKEFFVIEAVKPIPDTHRTLYLLRRS